MYLEYAMTPVTVLLNVILAGALTAMIVGIIRRPAIASALNALASFGAIALVVGMFAAIQFDHFYAITILSMAIFGYGLVLLAAIALLLWRNAKWFSSVALLSAASVVAVGIDAFLVEPEWLETTEYVVRSPKLTRPIKIVLIADLQTNSVGDYERRALREAKALNADLILFAGDYLQQYDARLQPPLRRSFCRLMEEARLSAPMGVFAVRGNTDWDGWEEAFDRVGIRTIESTASIDLGGLLLTGLSVDDSFARDCPDPVKEGVDGRFHLVLGHSPNFALAGWNADLLLCGHTHGGQVQVPGIGPLITSSLVPRSWASGLTEIRPGALLLVSRGVGRERALAPSLRFNCRPELAVIHLVPGS